MRRIISIAILTVALVIIIGWGLPGIALCAEDISILPLSLRGDETDAIAVLPNSRV